MNPLMKTLTGMMAARVRALTVEDTDKLVAIMRRLVEEYDQIRPGSGEQARAMLITRIQDVVTHEGGHQIK